MRYIELNPVRANMVRHPGEYQWSSYAINAQGRRNPIVTPHNSYDALGNNAEQRQYAYRELFRQQMDSALIHDVRESLNQELVLGSDKFKDKIKEMSKRQVRRGRDGRPSI